MKHAPLNLSLDPNNSAMKGYERIKEKFGAKKVESATTLLTKAYRNILLRRMSKEDLHKAFDEILAEVLQLGNGAGTEDIAEIAIYHLIAKNYLGLNVDPQSNPELTQEIFAEMRSLNGENN